MPHIMIIDDSDEYREPIVAALRRRDYTVSSMASGTLALLEMRKMKPDLVILDMVMPDMDGISVLRSMRNHLMFKDVPVLFLTGRDSENVLLDAKSLGAYCLLKYCVTIDELCTRVAERVGRATAVA